VETTHYGHEQQSDNWLEHVETVFSA